MAYQKLQPSRALAVIKSDDVDIPNPAMLIVSSTTTGASAGKLIDSAGDFVNKGVKVGDIVYGGTTVAATVTGVDSDTQLSVSTAVGTTTAYKIFSNETPNNGCVLYVGTGGDLEITTAAGDTVEFANMANGTFLPVQVLRVLASGATADIVALW